MSDLVITDTRNRVFYLNIIELAVVIFRGPDADEWTAIINTALPEILSQAPQDAIRLTKAIKKLQSVLPDPTSTEALTPLETEYVRLFVAGRGGVVAPLYESCHLAEAPRIMGDSALSMRTRLNECGLKISLDSNEPPDHIAIELEYLYHQFITAWTNQDPNQEAKARDFASHEMLPWIRRFRETLADGKPHPAYLVAVDLTVAVLEAVA